MSIHKSLKLSSTLTRARNVMTRFERLERLKELGKFDEAKDSVFHLPKTKSAMGKKVGKKKKKKKEEAAEGAAAAPGAAPAAGAKPAAGAAKPAAGAAAAKGAAPAAKAPAKK